jgi:long-chain acyl-CoA synthetase
MEREFVHQFNDAQVEVVVTCDFIYWYKLRQAMSKVPTVKHVVITSIPDYLPFPISLLAPFKLKKTQQYVKVPRADKLHFFKELIAQNQPTPPKVDIGIEDLAVLQYTGGTTGVSKGAKLLHRNLSYNTQQVMSWFPGVEHGKEVLLACLPYFHSFGMTVSMNWPVAAGAHIVLAPNPRDIADLVKSISTYRVTLFPALPALYVAINNFPGIEGIDISSIKGCFSGSAPLPVEVLEKFEKLTGGKITEGFGLTETSPVTHVNPLFGLRKIGSIGVPVPGTDQKVVDIETGEKELGIGQEGELCIKGPQVMGGYLNRDDETAKMIRGEWLYTGDLAVIDEDGYCKIVGRKKDMIVAGGYNVYPDEIDGVLFEHPAVLEAATIGVPDEKRGETVKSFVVLKPGKTATADEIREHCRKQLAAYKVPVEIEFLKELPKSTMMKILRKDLREMELQKRKGAAKPAAAKGDGAAAGA